VSEAEKYVLAAYAVVLGVVLAYLLIISLKVSRLDRELAELAARARDKRAGEREREEARVG
jgi:hypothetical protein